MKYLQWNFQVFILINKPYQGLLIAKTVFRYEAELTEEHLGRSKLLIIISSIDFNVKNS